MAPNVLFVTRSGDRKLGGLPASYSARGTCPPSCPLFRGACYAESIRTSVPWDAATAGTGPSTTDWPGFLAKVRALPPRQLWRHNIAGDLPGLGERIDLRALAALVAANRSRRGFTYTHKRIMGGKLGERNASAIRKANAAGFTINLSADSLADADAKAAVDCGPVVVLLPADAPDKLHTPGGRTVQVCPVQTGKLASCAHCGACAAAGRKAIIGFRAHGQRARAADAIARGER